MANQDDLFIVKGFEPLYPIPNTSMGKLIYEHLVQFPAKSEALVDAATDKAITYSELLDKTTSLSHYLQQQNFGKDAFVAVFSENNIWYHIPAIAAMYVGAIVVPLNNNYQENELLHCLNITKPGLVFVSKTTAQKILDIKKNVEFIQRIVVIDGKADGCEALEDICCKTTDFAVVDVNPEEQVICVMASSGTTGLPKAAMLTHKNFLTRYSHSLDSRLYFKGKTFLGVLPFSHQYGFLTTLMAITLGQKLVVMNRFQEDFFLKTLQKYKIDMVYAVPPLVALLTKSPKVLNYDLSSLKEIMFSAASLGKEVETMVKEKLPNVKIIRQGYGLTEITLTGILTPIGGEKPGSCGVVLPYLMAKIRDPETGQSLSANQIGEICINGPYNMKGYFDNDEATRAAFVDGQWFRTGDLGYYDDDQYFYVVDRIKEIIKYKGFQIAPAEIEAALLTHPKIKDAALVGIPHEEAGEVPLAFVVKNKGFELEASEVLKFVEERFSSQKKLRGGVIFVAEIPKSPSGKILRRKLKDLAINEAKY